MINKNFKIIIVVSLCLMVGFLSGLYVGKLDDIPFVERKTEWSIGIYEGVSPFKLDQPDNISNPVLTAEDVTDIVAEYVADPFMIKENFTWYMFFEVMNDNTNHGDIGLATSTDGLNWIYNQIVLDEAFHLSYPYCFKWKNEYFMIPESNQANSVRLYKAINFPTEWTYIKSLLDQVEYVDSSIFRHDNKWWLFTSTLTNNVLKLYYSENLVGHWIEHPKSPVITNDAHIARPGGRILLYDDKIFRYAQDDEPTYGNQLQAFEITKLSVTNYEEKMIAENPVLVAQGSGWNGTGMHHADPHIIDNNRWIASVDGCREIIVFGFKY